MGGRQCSHSCRRGASDIGLVGSKFVSRPFSGGLFDFVRVTSAAHIIEMMAIQTQTLLGIILSRIFVDVIFAINSALVL